MRRVPIIAGIAIGVAALASGCGTSTSSGASSADTAFYGGTILVTAQAGHLTLPLTKIDEIKQVAGVKTAFPSYRFDAKTGAVETGGVAVADSIVAGDPTEAAWSALRTSYSKGHAIDADSSGEVVLGSAIAQELKKTIGDTLDLPINPSGGATSRSFRVVGILDVTHTGPDRIANINITDGQMLLKDSLPPAERD
ncbi:MAG TPA: ABC transporter permease, partial [Candidatus Dormibacteraeota bacterium]|nr:ABC transporter permease [Candidatus Dormibacteraeota bacterium]